MVRDGGRLRAVWQLPGKLNLFTTRSKRWYDSVMRNEFTAIIEQDEGWYIAYSPEVPGANGQGRTKDQAMESLRQAIELILLDRREDGLRGVPPSAIRETVIVG